MFQIANDQKCLLPKEILIAKIKKSNSAKCLQKSGETGGIASPQIINVILRNTCSKNQEIRLGQMPSERWPNWGVGVKGSQRPSEFFKIVFRWQNLRLIHDSPQFRRAFYCRFFLAEKLTTKVEIPLF